MNITVTDQEHCKKEIKLEIPPDQVKEELDKVVGSLARRVMVPGFRPGKVPKSIIMTRFKKEVREEVASKIIPDAFETAMKEKGLNVVGQPELKEFGFSDDEALSALFSIEVEPEFALAEFRNLPLTKRVYKVTDANVDRVLDSMREREAEMVPVEDRSSQAGDTVTASIGGKIQPSEEGQSEEILEPRDTEITLGKDNIIEAFNTALTGVKTGDTKEFSVTYPAEYHETRLAGHKVDYSANVTGIKVKELPELDDEFAATVDEDVKTLDELKAKIRKDLEHQALHKSERELEETARKTMLDRNQFEVPEGVVDQQAELRVRNFARNLARQVFNPKSLNLDWDALYESQKEPAANDVRWAFILKRVARAENVEVTDEEIDAEIEKLADATGRTAAVIRANLTKENRLDSIKEQIENRKALELVLTSADIKTEEFEGLGATDDEAEVHDEHSDLGDQSVLEDEQSAD